MTTYTDHARKRMQQRGIGKWVVDLLLLYGCEEYDGQGAVRHFFDKQSRRALRREIGRNLYNRFTHLWDAYVVEQNDEIITVGWRI